MPPRKEIIAQLESARGSRLLCYFTGDRPNQEAQIGDDVTPRFSEHLSKIGSVQKLDLLLYSRGGNTLTGFTLANALREFAEQINILIPFRAHSCATLMSLGAECIVMGPFGQLSPIDPSITTPHGPHVQEGGTLKFLPVSVEDVANYFELARREAGLKAEDHMTSVLGHLCQRVNPLALGAVYRAREQIGMLARKLLNLHMSDPDKVDQIVKQLTRELLSHDYLIGRREAKSIGLPVQDATQEEATLMWQLYEDVAAELKLSDTWNWENEIGNSQSVTRKAIRGILESRDLKHVFESTYQIKRITVTQASGKVEKLQITPLDEGWKRI